jgi:undecaprenyl diphosphate synthase
MGASLKGEGALKETGESEPVEAPLHVGIIMDGNGRWAAERSLPRFEGHRRGMEAVRETVRAAPELGVAYLTLFSFSSENWARPRAEVQALFTLLRFFIRSDLAELHKRNAKVRVIGSREGVPADICALLDEAERLTAENTGLGFQVAFNYGGRDEIARAVRRILEEGIASPADLTPELISAHLDTAGIPDPDLIIRTSGEIRLSNFLLWQSAYAELVFLPIYWPDFDRRAFEGALNDYRRRKRRYGGLAASAGA